MARIVVVRELTKIPLSVGQEHVDPRVVDVLCQSFSDANQFVDAVFAENGNNFIGRVFLAPAAIGLMDSLAFKGVNGLRMGCHAPRIVLNEACFPVEHMDFPIVWQPVFVGQQLLDHHPTRLNARRPPLYRCRKFLSQAPTQRPFNAPFGPRLSVLVAPVSNHAIPVVRARKQPKFPRNVGKRHRAVVHDEQGVSRPVVGLDDATFGQLVPINVHVFRPVVQLGQVANLL